MTSGPTRDASNPDESALSPIEFRRRLGISIRTLQRWKADGFVTPAWYTVHGHARYTEAQVEELRHRAAAETSGRSA